MIRNYFKQVESYLASSSWVQSLKLIRYDILEIDEEEILVYRIRVGLCDGGLVEISERIVSNKDGKIETTTYSYHWQNSNNELVKRWDNAPHHPEIQTHPYHVHIGKEDNISPGFCITGLEVIALIEEEYLKQKNYP